MTLHSMSSFKANSWVCPQAVRCPIELLQFDAGAGGPELPINGPVFLVSITFPGLHLVGEGLQVRNAAVQALSGKDAQFVLAAVVLVTGGEPHPGHLDECGTQPIAQVWRNPAVRTHSVINHSVSYADGSTHTNTIEGFWSLLKRAWYGSHHHYNKHYMPLYVAEACYKYNNRKNENVFGSFLKGCFA